MSANRQGLQQVFEQLNLSICARYPIIYLVSWEEERVCRQLYTLATTLKKKVYVWSATSGFKQLGESADETTNSPADGDVDPKSALRQVLHSSEKALYVLQDFHLYFDQPEVVRLLRDLAHTLPQSYKTLLLLSPLLKIPVELEKELVVIDVPLPTYNELKTTFQHIRQEVAKNPKIKTELAPDLEEKIIKAAHGLAEHEAERVFAKTIVNDRQFNEDDVKLIVEEKRQVIRKSELLEYYELQGDLANVGGLNNLKVWLNDRQQAFSDKARDYGLPEPRGLLLLGVQGCGKSLTAKAIASQWRLPLLRLDVGSIFGSYIGQSEANMRRAIKITESLSPCVLWIDEIEKGFSGLTDSGGGDAGTTKRVLASFLVWMQEKSEAVFVVATANAVKQLPPEFLRKGRFDEIFFVDLPQAKEREDIFKIHITKRRRQPQDFNISSLAASTEGYSGAEIEQAILAAMYKGFAQGREFTSADIAQEIKQAVPLSATMAEEIQGLRNWASTRARPAH